MKFFDGLYNFEIVLMVLGVLLFLVALVKLIKKPSAILVAFFLISIAMIGYPSVQSIEYQKGVISINKKVHDLEADPNNTALRSSLEQDIGKVEARPSTDTGTTVALATAHFALGNEAAAKAKLEAVLKKEPELPQAKELNSKMILSDRLKTLTTRVEAAPQDEAAKIQLNQAVSEVAKTPVANPKTLQAVTRAQAALKAH